MQYLVDTFENSGIIRLLEYVDDADSGRRVLVERLHVGGDTDIIGPDEVDDDYARRLYRAVAGMTGTR